MAVIETAVTMVDGVRAAAGPSPAQQLADLRRDGVQFEQALYGDSGDPAAEAVVEAARSATGGMADRLVGAIDQLNGDFKTTMGDILNLLGKQPNQAELLQLQVKSVNLFITQELSSKMVSKATDCLEQLVRGQ